MDILKDFGLDEKKVRDGVWIDLANGDAEIAEDKITTQPCIKLARADNPAFRQEYVKRMQPVLARARTNTLDLGKRDRIEAEVIAETVILDWRNFQAGGEPFPYTRANCMRLLTEIKFADFKERVLGLAQDVNVFRMQMVEDIVKN